MENDYTSDLVKYQSGTYYPSPNVVQYIFLAEFDIDKGSLLRIQHPEALPGIKEDHIAESMLPEGGHLHTVDTTIFYLPPQKSPKLKKTFSNTSERSNVAEIRLLRTYQKIAKETSEYAGFALVYEHNEALNDWVNIQPEFEEGMTQFLKFNTDRAPDATSPGEYSLVVYKTKRRVLDDSDSEEEEKSFNENESIAEQELKRFPVNKSMNYSAVDSKNYVCINDSEGHPYTVIFHNSDDLLEFEGTIDSIIDGLDTMDLDTSPLGAGPFGSIEEMHEEDILSQFCEEMKFEKETKICVSRVMKKLDSSVRRGAIVKAIGLCSCYQFINAFTPMIDAALRNCLKNPTGDPADITIVKELYEAINTVCISDIPPLTLLEKNVIEASKPMHYSGELVHNACLMFGDNFFAVSIPRHLGFTGPDEPSLKDLLEKFSMNIEEIYNGILYGKRVLFLGHNQPASDLCRLVLSACLLVSPPFETLTKRCFPYAHLTNIEFLQVPGYIAGVTNPIFQNNQSWWDVLCDISSGNVLLSKQYRAELSEVPIEELSSVPDSEFFNRLRVELKLYNRSEDWVRANVRDYTEQILSLADSKDVTTQYLVDSAIKAQIKSNTYRVKQLLAGTHPSFRDYILHNRYHSIQSPLGSINYVVVRDSVRLLQSAKVSVEESLRIFMNLDAMVRTDDSLLELLSMLPETKEGVLPIAMGLFHATTKAKRCAFHILKKLENIAEGNNAMNNMNPVVLFAFYQRVRDGTKEEDLNRANSDREGFALPTTTKTDSKVINDL